MDEPPESEGFSGANLQHVVSNYWVRFSFVLSKPSELRMTAFYQSKRAPIWHAGFFYSQRSNNWNHKADVWSGYRQFLSLVISCFTFLFCCRYSSRSFCSFVFNYLLFKLLHVFITFFCVFWPFQFEFVMWTVFISSSISHLFGIENVHLKWFLIIEHFNTILHYMYWNWKISLYLCIS